MSTEALDDLLSTGGSPVVKFPNLGDKVVGVVTKVERTQQTDFDTGKPAFWDDGNPKMQFVFHLATDLRDPEVEDDDGSRRLCARAQMEKAIKEAIRVSGAGKDQIVGGKLAVQYAEDGTPKNPRHNPPKVYRAQFVPGTGAAADLLADAPPAPAATDLI